MDENPALVKTFHSADLRSQSFQRVCNQLRQLCLPGQTVILAGPAMVSTPTSLTLDNENRSLRVPFAHSVCVCLISHRGHCVLVNGAHYCTDIERVLKNQITEYQEVANLLWYTLEAQMFDWKLPQRHSSLYDTTNATSSGSTGAVGAASRMLDAFARAGGDEASSLPAPASIQIHVNGVANDFYVFGASVGGGYALPGPKAGWAMGLLVPARHIIPPFMSTDLAASSRHRSNRAKDTLCDFMPSIPLDQVEYYYSMLPQTAGRMHSEHGSDPPILFPQKDARDSDSADPYWQLRQSRYVPNRPPGFAHGRSTHTSPKGEQPERRKCHDCGAEQSPEWRKGPEGPKTLCNACGLRYAKRLRMGQV